ncbi:MAG TPA: dicarboxylate/amino acid:cation symporter [Burkholderiaceae bacterium]|nr:dicarboxylate/amino acid:cation symporter [Burkholderiaceae bacterium]
MNHRVRPAAWILAAMVLGIVIGYVIFSNVPDKAAAAQVAGYVSIVSDIFLRLIKMLIAPLVFSTLVVGVAHMGDARSLGRVFGKAMGWFIVASLVSLSLGILLANLLEPGRNLGSPLPDANATANLSTAKFTLKEFVGHMVPRSFAEAMVNNEVLQIVVFSIFFGAALAGLGERARAMVEGIDALAQAMLKMTGYVMKLAPLAVMAAMTSTIAVNGLDILLKFAVFIVDFYVGLLLLWGLLSAAGFAFLGPRLFKLLALIREPFLLSFATASSEAAYPKILDALDRFGVRRRISSFVMPMGYSFNLDGSMMYCAFALLFIAQAYGVDLPLATQITMLLVLMVTSKGMAGVPRASLVVIAATLNHFPQVPEAGLLLILGVDTFLDMGRSATNAVGNSIATAVVAKWEGELAREGEPAPGPLAPAGPVSHEASPAPLTGRPARAPA